MTTSVIVSTPKGAKHKAIVEYHDQVEGNPETVTSLAGVVPPGDTSTFHVHSARSILIEEKPLDENND